MFNQLTDFLPYEETTGNNFTSLVSRSRLGWGPATGLEITGTKGVDNLPLLSSCQQLLVYSYNTFIVVL